MKSIPRCHLTPPGPPLANAIAAFTSFDYADATSVRVGGGSCSHGIGGAAARPAHLLPANRLRFRETVRPHLVMACSMLFRGRSGCPDIPLAEQVFPPSTPGYMVTASFPAAIIVVASLTAVLLSRLIGPFRRLTALIPGDRRGCREWRRGAFLIGLGVFAALRDHPLGVLEAGCAC